jgi:membrane-associated phospholipid phosphatase
MMKGLEMIDSLQLETSKERIIPLIATATFYLWATWMFKPTVNMKIPPNLLVFYMMLGACFSIFAAFVFNTFSKISLHTVAAGSLVGLLFALIRYSTFDLRWLLIGVILIAGVIGAARLTLKAHSIREVATGYLAGFTAQFIAFSIAPHFF